MITNDFDLSNGGFIRFMLKIGTGVAPCDNADPGEDIVVEYSTTGGAPWSGWPGSTLDETSYPVFTLVDLAIPAAAQSPNTSFRISQPSHSGAGEDNWVIDHQTGFIALQLNGIGGSKFGSRPGNGLKADLIDIATKKGIG